MSDEPATLGGGLEVDATPLPAGRRYRGWEHQDNGHVGPGRQ